MDVNLKQKWIESLRSGKYKQGKHVLRTADNEFCCLGVLCDISGKGEWKGSKHLMFSFNNVDYTRESTLGNEGCDIMGLSYDHQVTLINMNDGGQSFEQIANFIEEKVDE